MQATVTNDDYIALGRNFLATLDAQGDIFSLMTDDVEFCMPKLGLVRGKANLGGFFQALGSYVAAIIHHPHNVMVGDRRVAIEGVSEGRLQTGKEWKPDGANAGRFCVVYGFEGRLINQVYIYLDPDYCDETRDYYPWAKATA